MTSINKGLFIFIVLCLIIGGVTCSVPKQTTTIERNNPSQIIYPSLTLPSPQASLLVEFPAPKPEQYKTDRKPVTLNFSSFDKQHVRSKDPVLFSSGNMIIIDLKSIDEDQYAFPLPGAKVISPYAGRRRHSVIDLKTRAYDTIVAAFEGIVRLSHPYAAYGNVIVVRHYNGLETVYSHNSKNLVNAGDTVRAGQAIALTGRTGRATTEHLHFEIRIDGEHVNPNLFFDFEKRELHKKSFACVRNGKKLIVSPIDPFLTQKNYISYFNY